MTIYSYLCICIYVYDVYLYHLFSLYFMYLRILIYFYILLHSFLHYWSQALHPSDSLQVIQQKHHPARLSTLALRCTIRVLSRPGDQLPGNQVKNQTGIWWKRIMDFLHVAIRGGHYKSCPNCLWFQMILFLFVCMSGRVWVVFLVYCLNLLT